MARLCFSDNITLYNCTLNYITLQMHCSFKLHHSDSAVSSPYFLGYNLCTATATILHCTEHITMPCTGCLLRCTLNEYYLTHTTNSMLLAYSCCLDVRTAPDVYYYPSDKERRGGCHCSFYCSLLSPPSCLTSN